MEGINISSHKAQLNSIEVEDSKLMDYTRFKNNYLLVYFLMMLSEWIQGPYIYELYLSYGFTMTNIVQIFSLGFLSAALIGPILSSLADGIGRKKVSILFCLLYITHCLLLTSKNFIILVIGRILAGCATTILFSVFEAWMVNEHYKKGFSSNWLADTFSYITFINGFSAVIAGVLADLIVPKFNFIGPFKFAIFTLILGMVVILTTWDENYGRKTNYMNLNQSIKNALISLSRDNNIILIGLIQSLFEGAMYTFVFLWTPSILESTSNSNFKPSLGIIFSCFMISMSIGSLLFNFLYQKQNFNITTLTCSTFIFSSINLLIAASTKNYLVRLISFNLFELGVGVYYPCIFQLRNLYLPESIKATLLSIFRIPLNFVVIFCLLLIPMLDVSLVLLVSSLLLLTGSWMIVNLANSIASTSENNDQSAALLQ